MVDGGWRSTSGFDAGRKLPAGITDYLSTRWVPEV